MLPLLLFVVVLLQFGEPQDGARTPTTLNNSSLGLILGDQCVTRDEVQSIVRAEMQSLTRHVAEIVQNNTAQLLQTLSPNTYTCNGTLGWRQVVFINMTDTGYNCPPGLALTSYSKRTCGRAHSTRRSCSSTTFSVGGSEYHQVCGRIKGYQVGATSAFYGYLHRSHTIEDQYVV